VSFLDQLLRRFQREAFEQRPQHGVDFVFGDALRPQAAKARARRRRQNKAAHASRRRNWA
jgi:hypothetical protein